MVSRLARAAADFSTHKSALSGSFSSSSLLCRRIPHADAGHSAFSSSYGDPLSRIIHEAHEKTQQKKQISASPLKLVLLGGPGVGKGTWATLLSMQLNIPHISTGDIVRKELSSPPSEFADMVLRANLRDVMKRGKLIPDHIIVDLLLHHLQKLDPHVGFILDGFPRTITQAKILDAAVGRADMAVNLRVKDDVLVAKCLGRRVCSHCGKDYNLAHVDIRPKAGLKQERIFLPARLPPPECASKLKVREDDSNEAAVRERIRMYRHESEPLEQHYQSQGKLAELDVGPGAEYVWPILLDTIHELEHRSNFMATAC